jgi:hypothetical protein
VLDDASKMERRAFERRVKSLVEDLPPLPDFSRFHDAFRPKGSDTPEGDIRRAFFLAYDEDNCDYLPIGRRDRDARSPPARRWSRRPSSSPIRPGFPILVPGQVISYRDPRLHAALDVKEIHGYRPIWACACSRASIPLHRIAPDRPNAAVTPDSEMTKHKLIGLSDIRRYFYRNDAPYYFVAATPFNLLGMDEWVRRFKFVNYIDCFDGHHPNVITPSTKTDRVFNSIEEITNYLLGHKEIADTIERNGPGGHALFLFFDEKSEQLAKEVGLDVHFPPAKLRTDVDNKVMTTRIGNEAGVPSVPNTLGKVKSYEDLVEGSRRRPDSARTSSCRRPSATPVTRRSSSAARTTTGSTARRSRPNPRSR